VSFPILIRNEPRRAEADWAALITGNGATTAGDVPHLLGSPELVADGIRPYLDLGFRTVIVRMPAPFDRETIDRIGEVRERLGQVALAAPRG